MFSLMFIFQREKNHVFIIIIISITKLERTEVENPDGGLQVYLEIDTENRYCCSVVRLSFFFFLSYLVLLFKILIVCVST